MARKPTASTAKPSAFLPGDEVLLRGRVTLVIGSDEKPVYVVQIHGTMVDGRVQMMEEAIERVG